MRRLLLLLIALIAAPATLADDLSNQTTVVIYWKKPLGGNERRDSAGSFGFRLEPAPGGPAPEISWWIVGGVAVGAAIVIHQENRKDKNDSSPRKQVITGG